MDLSWSCSSHRENVCFSAGVKNSSNHPSVVRTTIESICIMIELLLLLLLLMLDYGSYESYESYGSYGNYGRVE